jgi:hypothetical protein
MKHVPIPERMAQLPRDPRGYPIPFIVLRDADNRPHFTINDTTSVEFAIRHDLCAICGSKLFRGRWFVGGTGSAFHEHGAYIDGPVHGDCAEYALQVCPYLAAPKYAGRLDAKTLDPAKLPASIILKDNTLDPRRPEHFVAVLATGQRRTGHGHFVPKRPYLAASVWKGGECEARLNRAETIRFCEKGTYP